MKQTLTLATHTFTDDALGTMDGVAVAQALSTGAATPEEVVEAAIARSERVRESVNGLVVESYACARATVGQQTGPFAGVPAVVKDNCDVAGLPTRAGSAAFDGKPARRHVGPTEQFLSAGFTLIGKSRLPEFGLTASTEFANSAPTRNPWNVDHSAGASSGGSAALVAAGVVPIGHANDGGGSIRIPAAVNGLVGLKSTRGRLLDQPGVRQLPVNLVSEGVVTRTVRDTAHYLAAAEKHSPAKGLGAVGLVAGPSTERLRIGVIRRDVRGRAVHPETEAVLDSAVQTLADAGHHVSEARLAAGPGFINDFKLYWALMAGLMTASYKASHPLDFHVTRLDPFTRGLMRYAALRPYGVPLAIKRLRSATALYENHFADVDVLVTPVLSHPAPRLGEMDPTQPFDDLFNKLVDYVGFTPLNNIGGGPAISVPHLMMADNLPGSVQLCGPAGSERRLLELAYELEELSPFPTIWSSR